MLEEKQQYGTSIFDAETKQLLLRFDINFSEKATLDADITAFPVEAGFAITDNHQSKQRMCTINGIVTNTPLDGDTTPQRARRAFDVLDDLCESGRVVLITTRFRVYERALIKSYDAPTDAKTAQELNVTINIVEIKTALSQSVTVPAEVLAVLKRASGKSKTDKTTKDKPPTPEQTNGKNKSVAKWLANTIAQGL